MNEIVEVKASDFGLEESKAKQIANQFKPMLDKMQELECEFNEVQEMQMSAEKVKAAKELRLKYVKVRTGTAAIHKEQKAFYLAGGRYVDGWKNAQVFASQGIEEKLSDIENHFAKIEAEKIEQLRQKRWGKLSQYMEQEPGMLGVMEQDVFENLFNGAKAAHQARVEAERKAEEERKEAERIEKLGQSRKEQLLPMWKFVPEAFKSLNIGMATELEFRSVLEEATQNQDEYEQSLERVKKEAESREKAIAEEKKKREAEAEKERKQQEAKLKAEREAREKAEAEIKARKDAEEKARKKAEAEAKKAAKAPVKNQLSNWVNSLEMPKLNTSKISSEDDKLAESISQKFQVFKDWALSQIENY